MRGRYCEVVPLDPATHAAALYEANALDVSGRDWTYLSYGPFASLDAYLEWMRGALAREDSLFHAIVDSATAEPVGVAAFLRIDPPAGSIEVGSLSYSPRLQRQRAATEAMFLMMKRAFGLGYRRYEWKCDSLNARSRAAAQRLGFTYEGLFRQATVYKARNRDTAWFSIIDSEWPRLEAAYERWLDPANFDANGKQYQRLADLTAGAQAPSHADT